MRAVLVGLLFSLISTLSLGQTTNFYTDRALGVNPLGQTPTFLSYAQVRVCSLPLTTTSPCTPVAAITDQFGNSLGINGGNFGQLTTDFVGRFSFGCGPGNYQVQVAATGSNTPQLSYPVTCPSGSLAILTSPNTWTGINTYNGNVNMLVGQNTINAYNINNIAFIDSHKYACTATGIGNLLADATGQANAEGCLSGFTSSSEIDIGGATKTGVVLKHPAGSSWTFNGASGTACGIKLFGGNSFSGEGAAASNGFALIAANGANLDSLLCTDPNAVGGTYTRTSNVLLYNPNGATLVNGALHAENMVDGSAFSNVTVANYSGIGVNWRKNCCSAATWNLVSNGNYGANALPFWLNSDITHNNVANHFFASSIGHPGAGKNNLLLTGLNRYWCNGNAFYGLYLEGASGIGDTTTAAIDVNCYGGTSFYDVTMSNDDPASTRYLLQIETGVEGVNALNLESGISTNIVNDIPNGITVTTTPGAFPGYKPINYMSIPTWTPFLHIGGAAGGPGGIFNRNLLFSASQPTLGSGFGTSPSIPTNNGATAFSINVGTGGTATTGTVNFNATATNRWVVTCQDRSTFSTTVFLTRQTASTTTSATVGNFNSSAVAAAWAAGDILDCLAAAE